MKQVITLCEGAATILENDPWVFINSEAELAQYKAAEKLILPLKLWELMRPAEISQGHEVSLNGVWLSPDDDEELLTPLLHALPLIALQFPSFRDGRAYTQAYVLKTRLGWCGELRAVGDVLRDQLSHMRQCGFTSFAVREDKSVVDALKGLSGISVLYGRSVIEPRPLFRRR
jgi:uncharacterized protein (DUF934 family)